MEKPENIFKKDTHYFYPCKNVSWIEIPRRQEDFKSESGSMYWYEKDGFYRHSDHWGRAGESYFDIKKEHKYSETGYCLYADMIEIMELCDPELKKTEEGLKWLGDPDYPTYETNVIYTFFEFGDIFFSYMVETDGKFKIAGCNNHCLTETITVLAANPIKTEIRTTPFDYNRWMSIELIESIESKTQSPN